mmetsp:Transcript_6722/g.21370  ORF Transcript_6722/g.21370 Transcript_6722/m.21370 type:complete len:209 (-) Transcript_6722:323-949(-)
MGRSEARNSYQVAGWFESHEPARPTTRWLATRGTSPFARAVTTAASLPANSAWMSLRQSERSTCRVPGSEAHCCDPRGRVEGEGSWRLSEGRRHVAAARGDAADDAEVAEGGADEEGGAARDVCDEKLHRHVLAVHVSVDVVADRLRHPARVRLEVVLVQKGRLRQHDRVLAVPPDVPPAVVLQPPAPPDVQPRVEADEGALRVPPRL